ncbi:MAG TPA: hypothetical protein VMQ48_03315 [Candidatus Saccharimonadales bacterium]|nr:hypothetical protein [Candidatus Saccharimonadales bacterium]
MQNKKLLSAGLIGCLVFAISAMTALPTLAATKNKTVENMVVKSSDDSKETIKAVQAGYTYTIDASSATLKKESKSGKSMNFSDFKDGDVISVKGSFNKRDVTATSIWDLSITKSATMYGVVDSINTATQTVKIKTIKRGKLTVAISKSTKVTYGGKKKKFTDIRQDDKILVTGAWDSSKDTITKTKNFDILVKDDYKKLDLDSTDASI